MRYLRVIAALPFLLVLLAGPFPAAENRGSPDITGQQIIDHLNQTIAWYQHVTSSTPAGAVEDVLLEENVRASAKQVVQKAFDFARAQAAYLSDPRNAIPGVAAEPPAPSHSLEQTASAGNERIQNLQKRLNDLNQQIAKAPRKQVGTLQAQRDTISADLAFAKVAQAAITNMLQFASGSEKGTGLIGKINLLATSDSMPAALNSTPEPAASGTRPAAQRSSIHPETAGIAALVASCLQLVHERGQIDTLVAETKQLRAEVLSLRAPQRAELRAMLSQSDTLAAATIIETDPAKLKLQQERLGQMAARFKALSGPILPLAEQGIALTNVEGALSQWRETTDQRLQSFLGYLGFRFGTLVAAVIILLIISEVVRRATLRYVHETRRRRQFVLIRRFVVAVIAVFIVIFASVSGIGSFATVAGFVTAGLAVALQNVILSVVAYFFLIGRYGLRTGDRVTVSGLTGQVIEVGLVRLYLMEFAGTGTDLHSTGRVAVFSNSVIFQPAALIKQAPGTEYVWHGVSVTLSPDAHLDQARERITAAVAEVYQSYRPAIESQHAAFERAANLQLADPAPIGRAQYANGGTEVIVRYPVQLHETREVDEKVINAVMHEIEKEPALTLASGGYPHTLAATQ